MEGSEPVISNRQLTTLRTLQVVKESNKVEHLKSAAIPSYVLINRCAIRFVPKECSDKNVIVL
jgi:hypothetical protein